MVSNFYGYIIANDISSVAALAYAPKYELVMGSTEIGLAGFYRMDMAPRLIVMATFPLGQMDWYLEGVGAWGSDKTFVSESGGSYTIDDTAVFQATAGFSYKYSDALGNISLNTTGQVWYNGEGYWNPSLVRLGTSDPLRVSGIILAGDMTYPDMLYGAASISLGDIYRTGLSAAATWYGGLAGATGKVTPSLTYKHSDQLSLAIKMPVNYGPVGAEFSPNGNQITPTLEAKLLGNTTISFAIPLVLGAVASTPFVLSFEFAKERF